VSALKTGLDGGLVGAYPRGSARAPRAAFVLPRLLRRPARFLGRLTSGEIEPPRFAATVASALLLASAGLYGMMLGGHGSAVAQAISARSGFAVEDIRIEGNRQTSEIDIFEKIGLDGWTALIGFDVAQARARIAQLPWVEEVAVRKVYPSTLEVELVERQPFAVWQHGRRLAVIDAEGKVIAPTSGRRHASLPLVIGMGAHKSGIGFLERMREHGALAARTVGYIRVADRRWDLRLDNGITIRLPEEGFEKALRDVAELDRRYGLLSRDVEIVDMRFADRVVLRLTDEAKTQRDTMLKQRIEAVSRAGRRI
jgi:cell division protein FtsQ